MELKLDSGVLAVTQRRQQQVVDVKEDKKWRGIQLSHPCYYRTNKLQSGTVGVLLRCPHCCIHPVTLQITASGLQGRFLLHASPRAGPLSQGNQGSQRINQTSSKVPTTWLTARSSFLLSFFISATQSLHGPEKGCARTKWFNCDI